MRVSRAKREAKLGKNRCSLYKWSHFMHIPSEPAASHRALSLDSLGQLLSITDRAAGYYKEKCMVCFHSHGHTTGVRLTVVYKDSNEVCQVVWSGDVTRELRRHHADLVAATDPAACAIALSLVEEFTEYSGFRQASRGTTVDYYLVRGRPDDDLIFNEAARLEVSGILRETEGNTVEGRIGQKLRRLRPEGDLPTLIVVVEFSQPWSKMVEA